MMTEFYANLFIGSDKDCPPLSEEWAIIHACKHPCFIHNKDDSTIESSITYEKKRNLYLNMVDMEKEPVFLPTLTMFRVAESFIDFYKDIPVLVHCNKGLSRSPSIVLYYLARKGIISNLNYEAARRDFLKLYPYYKPTNGIRLFLATNWNTIL